MEITNKQLIIMKKWLLENKYTKKVHVGRAEFRDAVKEVLCEVVSNRNAKQKMWEYLSETKWRTKSPKKALSKSVRAKKVKGNFYKSREWRTLRVKALINNGRKCCLCGRNPKEHGIILHVDHIKPRSKYPELELKLRNLQILCEDCNLGKSNKYEDDWR